MDGDHDLNRPPLFSIDLNEDPPPLQDQDIPPATPPPLNPDHDAPAAPSNQNPPEEFQFMPYEAYMLACRVHGNVLPARGAAAPAEFPGEAGLSAAPSLCGRCGQPELPGATMICDGCDRGFHLGCAVPPALWHHRIDDWVCPDCRAAGVPAKSWRRREGNPMLDINAPPPSETDGDDEVQIISATYPRANNPDKIPMSGFATSAPHFPVQNPPLLPESSSRGPFYYPDVKQFMPAFNSGPGSMYLPMDIDSMNEQSVPHRQPIRRKRFRTNILTPNFLGPNQNIMDLEALQPRFTDSSTPPKLPKYLIEQNGRYTQSDLKAGFPIQFEDYYLIKLGEIDSRMAYHTNYEIYPVGFVSYFHDKITGSLFEFEISDGGIGSNNTPLFTIRRIPCSSFPLPNSSTILYFNNNSKNCGTEMGENSNNSCVTGTNEGEEDLMILLDEPCQSDQDITEFLKGNSVNAKLGSSSSSEVIMSDRIGEFFVQGDSLQSAWSKVSSTLISAVCESYKQSGSVQFCCNHGNDAHKIINMDNNIGNLSRFSNVYGPQGVPKSIRNEQELEASCSAIREWLEHDRAGLELELVQEIIENVLPSCTNCPKYQVICKRNEYINSFTVASENLIAVNRTGDKWLIESLYGSRKIHGDTKPPLGKSLSTKLPANLTAEVFQVWEFMHRFKDAIGLKEIPSFEELEEELINPWPESPNRNGDGRTGDDTSQLDLSKRTLLATIHSSLLKILITEATSRVACFVDPTVEIKESKPRRGRKKEVETSSVVMNKETKIELLTINVLTWPELVRRYGLVVKHLGGCLDLTDLSCSEGVKIFRCLHGDGGVVFGAVSGISGMEADANILVEAQKRISDAKKESKLIYMQNKEESRGADVAQTPEAVAQETNVVPEWARPLENVRKLPTNVGTRIRKCVFEALEKNPPDWARKTLEHSISKGIYKGNASGPTKKLALSVLADATVGKIMEPPKPAEKKPPQKERTSLSVSDAITKKCRIILRQALCTVSDKLKNFCNLLGTSLVNSDEEEFQGIIGFPRMVSRPMDFRSIDLRLFAGAYDGSHEAFLEDIREVLQNLRTVYANKSSQLEKVDALSEKFESLYTNEVLDLAEKLATYSSNGNPNEDQEKELLETLNSIKELTKAPWDDGVCKVCGVDRDDKSVLLCDTCDSEYHTYCLNPPLARIPEGNWYCPTCISKKKGKGKAKVLEISNTFEKRREKRSGGKETYDKAVLSKLLETMAQREYWELSVHERIFLMKFLCDEMLNSAMLREHIDRCIDKSFDFQNKLKSLNFELRNLKVKEDILAIRALNNFGNINNDGAITGEETGEPAINPDSMDEFGNNNNNGIDNLKNEMVMVQETIMDLESRFSGVCLRREFIGRDVLGRLYWVMPRPDKKPWIVVDGSRPLPNSEEKNGNSNPTNRTGISKSGPEVEGSFVLYESDEEISALVNWLNDIDPRERELKESILSLQRVIPNKNSCSDNSGVLFGIELVSPLKTKALTVLERKYGGSSEEEVTNEVFKRPKKKGKMVDNDDEKFRRCECLEPVWGSKTHCFSCHVTFESKTEFESHDNSKCGTKLGPKSGEEGTSTKTPKCPFDFDEICKNFVVKGSLKEDVQQIGLLGSNGVLTFINQPVNQLDPNHPAAFYLNQKENNSKNDFISQNIVLAPSQPAQDEQVASKDESNKDGGFGNNNNNNNSRCTVPEAALRPVKESNSHMLKLLKINLLDMEAALPEEAWKRVKLDPVKRNKWRGFVKKADSIYEMVQATILLENMIKSEYIKNAWFHWSSLTAASKTPSITSLALRVYTLDDCLVYTNDSINPSLVSEVSDVSASVKSSSSKGKRRKELD